MQKMNKRGEETAAVGIINLILGLIALLAFAALVYKLAG